MVVVGTELDAVQQIALNRFLAGITGMKVGDDGTTPSEGDTDIGNEIGSSGLQGTDISVAGQITYTTRYGITEFVGDTIREVVLNESTGDIKTRNLTPEKVKGSDEIFWVDVIVKAIARNK